MAPGDSYEKEQKRLLELFNDVETPESNEDPYADDGESLSDDPLSSNDAAGRLPRKHASNLSGESSSPCDSDDSDKTFCPSEDERRNENISVNQNLHVSEATSSGIYLSSNDLLVNQDERLNSPDISDQPTCPIIHAPRTSAEIPLVEEGWSDTVTDIPDFNYDNAASAWLYHVKTINTINILKNDGLVMQGHWPEQMPARPGTTKKKAFLKCKFCTQKKIRKETSYRCKGYSVKPPLCPSCFEPYHASLLNPNDD
ncbi:unnamed protein product [Parnassius mnemosyne]|uniref:Uncharacterized protein n=1 Tax=Parnassius mnemosyne TaxID=213953 RepID=A0AAV1KY43_9NEOP